MCKSVVSLIGVLASSTLPALADEPCGDLGECRVLIEVNATDGDIGFHVLFDGEGWEEAQLSGPGGQPLFDAEASSMLADQTLTENFFESAEPVCEEALREEPEEEVVTLPEFLARFPAGNYGFSLDGGEQVGSTMLTHTLPAAPADVEFDGKWISWRYGEDLGECTTWPEGFMVAPEEAILAYEVAMEPDDDALSKFGYRVVVPASVHQVLVPRAYLKALPAGTPLKVEVGAIEGRDDGSFGNQTFSEADGFCNLRNQMQCESEEE
ncbi:hypothetical protein FCL40_07040 [Ferrimonas sediminicola]|uniref:Uncharacterized protein n=1 Tax=Ferrimonas sediminicola TaxID=2569538 RepID=A0A4U1BFK8_9GAMM|nr:hypothetical protein [Ferrimonas sediminicola]TKB49901.1 hypothetical protein FCL40_07040 [Ferrimonas sediminicola]